MKRIRGIGDWRIWVLGFGLEDLEAAVKFLKGLEFLTSGSFQRTVPVVYGAFEVEVRRIGCVRSWPALRLPKDGKAPVSANADKR